MGFAFALQKCPAADKALFVGQGQGAAVAGDGEANLQPGKAHDGGHGPIGRHGCGIEQGGAACGGLNSGARQACAQIGQAVFGSTDGDFGFQVNGLLCQQRHIAPARQGHNVKVIRTAGDQVNGVLPHRPC